MITTQLENSQSMDQLLSQLSVEGLITPELSRDIQDGRVKLMPTVEYVRAEITAQSAGEIELLKASQDEEIGLSTFNGQRLQNGHAVIGTGIMVRVGKTNASDKIKEASLDTKLPGAVQGSHVIVKSDGKEVFNLPGSVFLASGSNTTPEDLMFRPELPVFLADGKKTEFKLEVPQGVTVPGDASNKYFIEVAIYGYKTVNR